jgi:hypothetical protein
MMNMKQSALAVALMSVLVWLLPACGASESGCEPAAVECLNSSTYRSCDDTGEWSSPQACQTGFVCQDGVCSPGTIVDGDEDSGGDCAVGASICVGNLIQNCGPGGVWGAPVACLDSAKVCRNGECVIDDGSTICAPGQKVCKDELTLQTCDSTGKSWQDSDCAEGDWCYEGACIPEGTNICDAGTETHCKDLTTLETCNADGTGWTDPTPCGSEERCYDGQCIDENAIICEPGVATRCQGANMLQGCNATGTDWDDPVACPEEFICDEGRCIEANCEPGVDFLCTERGRIMWCNDEGDGYLNAVECPSGMVCSPNSEEGCSGVWSSCEPNSTACDPEDLSIIKQCNEDGTGWLETTIPCPAGSVGASCRNGQCLDLCDMAKLADSYIGCEYWPVTLMNDQLDAAFQSGDQSEYAVVVSNTNNVYTAQVKITHPDGVNRNVTVAPNSEMTIRLPWKEELITYKGDNAFHLTSTIPVTVYQFNPISAKVGSTYAYTNDASLLLPSHVLGNEYLVMNYRTSLSTGNYLGSQWVDMEFPSFFTIVAAHDDTTVTVTAHAALAGGTDQTGGPTIQNLGPGGTYTTTLDAGQVLQFLSSPDYTNVDQSTCFQDNEGAGNFTAFNYCLGPDLSGSEVQSDKPVAVYAGNACAFVPFYYWACDHLEQQMFPTKTWTTQYIVGKLQTPVNTQPNLYKILASEDGTTITTKPNVTGQTSPHHNSPCNRELNRGDSCMIETSENFIIISNPGHPIMVGQFMVGQNYDNATNTDKGDPAFILVPPVEQFRKEYVFLVPNTYASDYITLMATRPDISITLDGNPLTTSFTRIGNADAYVMTTSIADGTHSIVADSRLGVLVYGYDSYVSYAYPAGLDLSYVPY